MVKPAKPREPSQSWRTFLKNQADAIWMCDFCVQYTVKFTALYIFIIMELGSRKVVHINVTRHPTQAWVKQPFDRSTGSRQAGLRTGKFGTPPSTPSRSSSSMTLRLVAITPRSG